jgi:nicotinamidase-related amidase
MQVGLFEGDPPRHDADGVIRRINEIAKVVRATGGMVIFIQHEDDGGLKRDTASRNYEVVVVKDAHTTRDRSHLDAKSIITHHHWMCENLILPRNEVKVLPATSVIAWLHSEPQS